MHADLYRDCIHGLFDDNNLGLGQRWVLWNWIQLKGVWPSLPIPKVLLSQLENLFTLHVSRDQQRGVVRNVVPLLNGSHLLLVGGQDHFSVADDVLPAEVIVPYLLAHFLRKMEEGVGFCAIVFSGHDWTFAFELFLQKQRRPDGSIHKLKTLHKAIL